MLNFPESSVPMSWPSDVADLCCCLFAQSYLILCDPMDYSRPGSSVHGDSHEYSQKHWSGLPFPCPGDLPDPGIEPGSSALAGGFFTTEPPGKPGIIGSELI